MGNKPEGHFLHLSIHHPPAYLFTLRAERCVFIPKSSEALGWRACPLGSPGGDRSLVHLTTYPPNLADPTPVT